MKLVAGLIGIFVASLAFSQTDLLDEERVSDVSIQDSLSDEGDQALRLEGCISNRKLTAKSSDVLWSSNHDFSLVMQPDGNLVLYKIERFKKPSSQWASHTSDKGSFAAMQNDGNFVIYNPQGKAVWSTHTSAKGARLCMQDDGNLVVYDGDKAIWDRKSH